MCVRGADDNDGGGGGLVRFAGIVVDCWGERPARVYTGSRLVWR